MIKKLNNYNGDIYGKEELFAVEEIHTLREMFEKSTTKYAKRVAFLQKYGNNEPYTEITYKKFREDVYALATGLIDMGLKDKKIAVIGENRYEWAISYMAVVSGVGTVVPIDKELPFEEVKFLLEFSGADAVIASKKVLKAKPELADMSIICITMDDDSDVIAQREVIEKGNKLLMAGNTAFADSKVSEEDVNIILFTSGTTGVAKGVMLSHKNICHNIMNACSIFKIEPEDRAFSVLPLHHTYECTGGFLCQIYSGSSIAYCQGLKYMVKNMQESAPTIFFAVPLILESIYKMLIKTLEKKGKTKSVQRGIAMSKALLKVGIDIRRKLFAEIIDNFGGKINMFCVGAAKIEPSVLQFFNDIGITSLQGYGMTECSPFVAANRVCRRRNDSAGMPLPQICAKIDNPNENGVGEIVVKGDSVMCGYYKNPEETEKVLKDGWLYTGDMGYIEDGFIYITGRAKNVIITANGKNVFPEEIEEYLCRSPYISEAMVYESTSKDNRTVITAQVYPEYSEVETHLGKDAPEEEIKKLILDEVKNINKNIPQWKAVGKLIIRKEEFIKTTTKKIKRSANMEI